MKTKRRLKVRPAHRHPRTLSELSELLFPNSPITVEYDFTLAGNDREYHWHIYVEGEWIEKVDTLAEAAIRIYEVIESQGNDWSSNPLRIVPDWSGWTQITPFALTMMDLFCNELREQNEQYYKDE